MDEAAWDRALKRRKILEELVSSEESYVADLKVLTNVYFTLLASVPSLSQHTQSSIQRNIAEILRLHEDLLRQLHLVLLDSDVNQIHLRQEPSAKSGAHVRWHSLDISGKRTDSNDVGGRRKSFDISETRNNKRTALVAEPKQVADIARVFQNMMNRFFAYEEYGAKYEMMVQDMASTYSSIPNWHAYERGIEALANSLTSINGREANSRKGLTFGDLLIKPIQRVCKYPLLFSDLHKQTPVIDCPESHSQIEKVLCRLRETTKEINKATDDPRTRDRIQKTWLLQDRFGLQDESLPMLALRQLGHVLLCGVLHVAYQTKMGVEGEYMVCALFKSCLLLATISADGATYEINVGLGLSDLRIEETDNGKDLQCYTALYSWKVIFESDHRLFELVFSASSAKEEEGWRTCLLERSAAENRDLDDGRTAPPEMCSTLKLDLKSIGHIFGQPGTLARRISVQRAATVGPKTNISQVIIKNTHALRDNSISSLPASPSMNRSQSLLTTSRIPVLVPKRADRVRLEHALSDVWTRDILPYPGMGAVRGDHLIRASASSMMRKLSMASITSSFTKRSSSHASLVLTKGNDAGKELEHVDEKNPDGSDSDLFEGISTDQKTVTPVPVRPIMPPPRTSSASGNKRLKGNRLLKNPKLPDPSFPGTNEVPARTDAPADGKPPSKTRTKWNSRLGLVKTFSSEGLRGFLS
ncbi:MAG: hypothetical protein M1830_004299 [Pleopsidium flavum]|nr:MAG: hypothetical protein M1830_004299 [Pleopsidium flavum]